MLNNVFFHHVGLNVSQYVETCRFYEGIGFKKQIEWTNKEGLKSCFFDTGNGLILEMHESRDSNLKASLLKHICVYVDNVDDFYELALNSGGRSVKPPYDANPLKPDNGKTIYARIAWVNSPNGEEIEILHWKDYDPANYRIFSGSTN